MLPPVGSGAGYQSGAYASVNNKPPRLLQKRQRLRRVKKTPNTRVSIAALLMFKPGCIGDLSSAKSK